MHLKKQLILLPLKKGIQFEIAHVFTPLFSRRLPISSGVTRRHVIS